MQANEITSDLDCYEIKHVPLDVDRPWHVYRVNLVGIGPVFLISYAEHSHAYDWIVNRAKERRATRMKFNPMD